jgi:putative phosphoesterase
VLHDRTKLSTCTCCILKILAILLIGFAGAVLAIWLFGASTVEVEGFEFKVGLVPDKSGLTEVHFPPFGLIEARTHKGPVKLVVNLEQISSNTVKAHIDNLPDQKIIVQKLQNTAREKVTAFFFRQIMVAFLGALILVFFIWRPGLVKSLLYSAASTLIILLILFGTFRSFDTEAFKEPEYKGVISMAPAAIKFTTNSLSDLEQVKSHTRQIVSNLGLLFSSADSLMAMANPEDQGKVVKVLLISDLHSNPVGIELTKTLTARFGVDFVINAGDLTDMGSKLETKAAEDLAQLGATQLFVGGNHDSPEVMEFIASLPDSLVLDGKMQTIMGVKVLGFADPLSAVPAVEYESKEQEDEALKQQITQVHEAIEAQGRPDILVVHDSTLAHKLTKLAGLIVAGHDHRVRMEQGRGWVFVNPGTTGASGLRGLYSEKGISYSAAIAYIIPDSGLVAVDIIKYNPTSRQFALERKLPDTAPARMAQGSETDLAR